jgi:hypothetical protein
MPLETVGRSHEKGEVGLLKYMTGFHSWAFKARRHSFRIADLAFIPQRAPQEPFSCRKDPLNP